MPRLVQAFQALMLSHRRLSPHHPPTHPNLQVFQAFMLVLAEAPGGGWALPEDLLAAAQNTWVQSTKQVT